MFYNISIFGCPEKDKRFFAAHRMTRGYVTMWGMGEGGGSTASFLHTFEIKILVILSGTK